MSENTPAEVSLGFVRIEDMRCDISRFHFGQDDDDDDDGGGDAGDDIPLGFSAVQTNRL
jgi:hypothetical protein